MNAALQVFHFHNGGGGGVLSVIKNLIEYSTNPEIENHVIYTVEKKSSPTVIDFPKAATVKVFEYNKNWNFYHTCKALRKLIPDEKAIIVAHDWLELGMVSQLGMQNPVVYFAHGDYDYYYDLAKKHAAAIDVFIGVAQNIQFKLKEQLPVRTDDVCYARMPVPVWVGKRKEANQINLVFLGRLSVGKGFNKLQEISKRLAKKEISVAWHFIGDNADGLWKEEEWKKTNATYHGHLNQTEIQNLLATMDLFILPSAAEGMPLSVVECMKAGVVPIVNDIEGGIQEIVINGETGFRIAGNDVQQFAEKIIELINNPSFKRQLSETCQRKANELFDPVINTKKVEMLYRTAFDFVRRKDAIKIYGSFLDKNWMPNWLATTARKLSKN